MAEQKKDTRFKPGQSGNLKGRPPVDASVRTWLKKLALLPIPNLKNVNGQPEIRPRVALLAEVMWRNALKPNNVALQWCRLLVEYLDGKAVSFLEMPKEPIQVNVNGGDKESKDPYTLAAEVIVQMVKRGLLPAAFMEQLSNDDGGAPSGDDGGNGGLPN